MTDMHTENRELTALLGNAVQAARTGGDILRRYYHDGVEIRNKSGNGGKSYDLVSDADEQSERAIADYLSETYPDHELLGEEALQDGNVDAAHLWVIDPLDGTNNFAHRIPHFAVSIGYYERGVAKVAAIYNPIRDEMYTAVLGGGAFVNDVRVNVSQAKKLNEAMVGCGFYYDRGDMMRSTLSAIEACFAENIHGIRRMGTASLDLCQVGCGYFEAFFEYKLSAWDFAAGALFVTEAGGTISDGHGDPLPLASSSVLASNGHLHDAMLGITRKYHPGPLV